MKIKTLTINFLLVSLTACGGGGESSSSNDAPIDVPPSVTPPTVQPPAQPLPTLSLSSYENKINAINLIGPISLKSDFPVEMGSGLLASNSYAIADFFNEGNYSIVSHTFEYNWKEENADKLGNIVFFRKIKDRWEKSDISIEGGSQGCLHPRKAVVSDFNGDGLPDVFFACTGLDLPPFPGEKSLMLINTGSGFKKKWISFPGRNYTHSVAAADINGDGYADLAIANMSSRDTNGECVGSGVFINDKNGNFNLDKSLIPSLDYCKTSYTTELIQVNKGEGYTLFLGGHESNKDGTMQDSRTFKWKDGKFTPNDAFPMVQDFGLVLDIVHADGNFYVLRTIDTDGNFYSKDIIQKIPENNFGGSSLIYQHAGSYSNGNTWINWLAFYQNKLISLIGDFNLSVEK